MKTPLITSIFLIFFAISGHHLTAQDILCFEAKKGRKKVGYLQATRDLNGNETTYTLKYELNVWVLVNVKLKFDFTCTYKDGHLVNAVSHQYRDGYLREKTICWWDGNSYKLKRNDKESVIETEQVVLSTIPIFFNEPVEEKIFSERVGAFLPIRKMKNGAYEMKLVSGNRNYYNYENGICKKFKLTHTLGDIDFDFVWNGYCEESSE